MIQPAARTNDVQECPESGHTCGLVVALPCRVRINGKDAVRAGDLSQCHGGTGVVSSGSSTVNFGGMPAARKGDSTSHGGSVQTGAPDVNIGGAAAPPPGLDVLQENQSELDRLRQRIRLRRERLADLDRKLNPPDKSDAAEFVERSFKLRDQGMPREYWSEREGIERARHYQRNQVWDLEQRLARDEARVADLEAENAARRGGASPPRTPADPLLDEPDRDYNSFTSPVPESELPIP